MSKRNRVKAKNKSTVSRDEYTKQKQKASIKSMYFNRLLMVRYFLAIFVFSNFAWTYLNWGSFIGTVGLFLLVLALFPAFEMAKAYGKHDPALKGTWVYFILQFLLCLVMCVMIWTAPVSFLFTFMTETTLSRVLGFGISLIGLVLSFLVLRRLYRVQAGADKQLQRILFFENKYNLQ